MFKNIKIDPFLLLATPILIFLIFANLGNQFLWYDEAQNAVLAKSVIAHGYPKASIGNFLVQTDETYGPGLAYIAQPWLQNYLCAFSFILFGESNTTARVLFAILGFLSLYLLYYLAKRLFEDTFLARLTFFIAATSVPFLLHLRQSRYYSLTIFLTLILLITYLDFLDKRKARGAVFVLVSFLLFHANFGSAIGVLGALFIHYLLIERYPDPKRFIKLYIWTFCLILPWVFIYKIWSQGAEGNFFSSLATNAKFYLSKINGYFFPYRFLIVALFFIHIVQRFILRRKIDAGMDARAKKGLIFIGFVFAVNLIFLLFVDFSSVRYIIYVIPLLFMAEAFIIKRVYIWNKFVGLACAFLLCFTNVLNTSIFPLLLRPALPLISGISNRFYNSKVIGAKDHKRIEKELKKLARKAKVRTYFFDYVYEITHDYDGPMEGVVRYLLKHSKPGETVKTHSFNANPIYLYTGLNVDIDFSKETYPEWIFLRDYWTENTFYDTAYFRKIKKRYKRIDLDYPDIWWENRPDDLSHHYFRTASSGKKISIYRKKR